tara:strand:- start:326 stop:580 length:255 start_codon:yes stop_codon:yes gene_type:complete
MKSDDRLHELIDKLEEVYIEDSTSDIRLLDAVKEVIGYLNSEKIKSFEIYTDDEDKVLVGNSLETALEILENNGYIVEWENEDE